MALLEVQSLRVDYGPVRATHDISFTVDPGEIVALIGSNGAGKSTTIKAVMGMVRRAGGSITWSGAPLQARAAEVVRQGIALSPEGRRVFPYLTVADNLSIGGYTRSRAERAERIEQMYGYFPRLRERSRQLAGNLSGGEQQMLAIGRALMSRPRLLLLDEPSLGLAPIVVQRIGEVLAEICAEEQLAVVLAEQNAKWALNLSKRGYILELGRTTLQGEAAALAADARVQSAYLGI
jgi:branched-chain amino acid transport system ATP-binding protein